MKSKTEFLLGVTVVFLLIVIGWMMWELSVAWRNERFLDATINKHTTTNSMPK